MPKTIRARITLLITFLMLLVLTVSGSFLYFSLWIQLRQELDDRLRFNAEQLLARIENKNGRLIFGQGDVDLATLNKEDDLVRLEMLDGTITASQGDDELRLPIIKSSESGFVFSTILDAEGEDEQSFLQVGERSEHIIRVISVPVVIDGQQVAWVHIGRDLEALTRTLNQLLFLLVSMTPIVLTMTALGGYWLAGIMLRPIEYIRQQADTISAQDLSKRLNLTLPDDEVGRLARTFNRMLIRLDDSFRTQQRFVSDASHELRTPLAIIRGEVDVTLEKGRQSATYIKSLQSIGEEAERMERLVNNLLWLARSDSTQLTLAYEVLDLTEMLQILVEHLQPQVLAATAQVSVTLPPKILIKADADRLIQLFLNLLENALTYAPSSNINICGHIQDDMAKIDITDTGPGIAPEHLPHLFKRFYRVDKARSRASGGSGLGLAIADEIARAHGGTLSVKSEVGHGAIFTVRLPIMPQ